MAEPTFDEQMVSKLEALLLANPGALSISIDGQSVTLADLTDRLDYFRRRVANANGTRPRAASINLSGF